MVSATPNFRPYRSILISLDLSDEEDSLESGASTSNERQRRLPEKSTRKGKEKERVRPPPWRRAVGRAFFLLDSEFAHVSGESIPDEEALKYCALVTKTFDHFNDEVIGTDVNLVDMSQNPAKRVGFDIGWEVDLEPARARVDGDSDVIYEVGETSSKPGQVCWNCRATGHSFNNCPQPRNNLQIRASRELFFAEKEAMPSSAIPYLLSYRPTEAEIQRRLDLADKFRPGRVSNSLADALFWIEPLSEQEDGGEEEVEEGECVESEESIEMRIKRRRGEWPWLNWMIKWGYPPGWIASKDPIGEVKKRLQSIEIKDPTLEEDEEEILEVYGGLQGDADNDTPPSTAETDSIIPESPNDNAPGPPDSPPPPPPPSTEEPPPPPFNPPTGPKLLAHKTSSRGVNRFLRPRRWARYDTDMFDSDRLLPYTSARPLPLGM